MSQPIPFGKYFLLERVNVGGMAEVFKAKATGVEGFERLVAVKRILPSIAEDEEFITMFIDEAKIAVQLTHTNIAQIFDLGKVDDSYFIALEHVRGKDMRAVFNRARQHNEPIPIPMACYVIMKVCEGLDYAHNKRDAAGQFLNLVHRDVSPQNLLVSFEGEVKVIDFGIAKAAGKVGKTQAGILKGKFGYMSPEQVQGLDIDRRSDIFGLGICLYELLTGERLFVAETDFATLEKVRNVEFMPPSTYNRRITEDLEQIVLKALARDRDHRYQTAMELHDDLQSFMYTSGSFFGRKDLGTYMHGMFAEEIARENARDQEYAALEFVEESTSLQTFDELEPVSAVSGLHDDPAATAPRSPPGRSGQGHDSSLPALQQPAPVYGSGPPGSLPPAPPTSYPPGMAGSVPPPDFGSRPPPPPSSLPPTPPPSPNKSTLLGIPQGASHGGSVPPPFQPAPSSPQASALGAAQSSGGGAVTELGMGWDDEELSTQIYDRPDELASAMAGALPGTGPQAAVPYNNASSVPPSQTSGAYAPHGSGYPPPSIPGGSFPPAYSSGSLPPVAGHAPPPPQPTHLGNPSPFDSAPQFPQVSHHPGMSTPIYDDEPESRSPRTIVFAVLSVVAIVGLIVGGLAIFQPAQAGVIHLRTTPADATVSLNGTAVTGTSPFVLQDIAPGRQHELWVDKEGYHRWSTKVELQPAQTMVMPPVTLKVFESGFALDSVPSGAKVILDGKALDQRTPVRLSDLAPGNHTVQLEKEGHLPWEIPSLHVTEGTVLELPNAVLTPDQQDDEDVATGRSAPTTQTDAQPAVRRPPVRRPPRRSRPKPRREPVPEPESEVAEVAAPDPEPEPEAALPEPEPAAEAGGTGTLRINTRPWSIVFVDGKQIGNTPQMNIELPAGNHEVTLVNDDFGIRKTVTMHVKSGEVVTRVLTLSGD